MSATTVTAKADWSGGKSPFNVSYGKLMMWLFLLSDAFTFSGFLVAYGLVRFSAKSWPVPEQVFDAVPFLHGIELPLVFVGIMTFILILSSVTMVLAVDAGHRMDRKGVQKWLFWTIIGGITFLSCQAFEWTHFIMGTGAGGANLVWNEYGPPDFAAFFFFITGFHGTHVLSGVVLNYLVYYNTVRGVYEQRGHYDMVEKVGLYWHFVDLVWVFVFTFFYLV
ncbi:MAG: cytochrome c oxidase subunit 3 [Cyclobacteriaceae bacterium]|nr:cytochrome c oxidase subunit 3 [Cyclobacteriaceae bacterium]